MALQDRIDQHLKEALKAGDKAKVSVLRGLKSDWKYRQIAVGEDLTDEQSVEVLNSAAKRRRESIEQFRQGGREDLAEKEEQELKIITSYLPEQLGEGELRQMIEAAIAEAGADSTRMIGQVMKVLMPKIKGRADGKMVNHLVTEILAK
ncbi:MAG TPA: GatB/YqeY domain-containing protein [Acidobacteriota bacterium]|nr:GatB/YqeY domain-containing protein [Acidobacteriota bacterium]